MEYWLETLGCPKNEVDSAKLAGTLHVEGYRPAASPGQADLVVVNTCAFIGAARQESVDTVLALSCARRHGARLVVTGCMAERYGAELAAALPEVDLVAGFGVPVALGPKPVAAAGRAPGAGAPPPPPAVPSLDLLELPRPPVDAPWAYVKVAEGCDRRCGFCAIPSFRGPQRSRSMAAILAEVEALDVAEVVLVAQDLASFGRDLSDRDGPGPKQIVRLVEEVAARVERTRLLYLYPSELTDALIEAMGRTGCHYFDLSLQHVAPAHLRRMRRWGSGERFVQRIDDIRRRFPDAAFRSSFIVGYPGETEEDHDQLLAFLDRARLDWAGFFAYSPEDGTHAAGLAGVVDAAVVADRLAELGELQDRITAAARDRLVGTATRVLVDAPGTGRSHREAPDIDGVILLDAAVAVGSFVDVEITGAVGLDLTARVLAAAGPGRRRAARAG